MKFRITENNSKAPSPRKGMTICYSSFDDKVYLYGGWNPEEFNYDNLYPKSLWSLDNGILFINLEWKWNEETPGSELPTPRHDHTMIFSTIPCPCLLIFGGILRYNHLVDDFIMIKLETKEFIKIKFTGHNPKPIAFHSANIIEDKMFVIGGSHANNEINTKIYVLNLSNFEWIVLKEDIVPRYGHIGMTFNKSIILIGGITHKTYDEETRQCGLSSPGLRKCRIH